MRAVIYARYSTEMQRDASIEDQIRLCREHISRQGWTYLTAYMDRAMSGASALRPGYQKLLEDARAGCFDVVMAEALDRLSRDQEDIAGLYKHLSFAGVKVVTLAEGEVSELHVGLKGTMNALFLKDLAIKIRRGLRGRIEDGRSAGGLAYGYEVERDSDVRGEPIRGGRQIHETEAQVVRRIFHEFAEGRSPRSIAKILNAESIGGPNGKPWGASTIHGNWRRGTGILNNELYRGRLVWNRQTFVKDPATGRRIARINPPSAWLVRDMAELRIVEEALWENVKLRQRHGQNLIKVGSSRTLSAARRTRYLFSGLLRCGVCGGPYIIISCDRYGCASHRDRGICSNGMRIGRVDLESRILAGLKEHLLTPELFNTFAAEFHAELNRRAREAEVEFDAARREIEGVRRRIAGIITAIEEGIFTASTRDQLLELEHRKAVLEAIPKPDTKPRLHPNLALTYREKVAKLHEALNQPTERPIAAELMRGLVEKVVLTPDATTSALRAELHGALAKILAFAQNESSPAPGGDGLLLLVAEEGFEPPTKGL